MSETAKKPTPPYLPFLTFKGFIERLHNNTLPTLVDKSLMRHISGGVQSHLMIALRFLKLTDEKGMVQERMATLHGAFGNPAKWSEELGKIITKSYLPVIGDLNIGNATDKQLDDAFRANSSLEGTMLDRATRFFLHALKDSKLPVSPFLLARKTRTPRKPKTPKNGTPADAAGKGTVPPASPAPPTDTKPDGMLDFPLHSKTHPGGFIRVSEKVDAEYLKVLELTVDVVRAYAGIQATK